MSQNKDRPKLRPSRFNKFESSNSTTNNNLSISLDTSRRSNKRISNGIPDYSQGKRMCYGLMHPPSSAVNLAQNRLQKLKQSLHADLQKRKIIESVHSDNTETEKSNMNINDSSKNSMELQSPTETNKSIYRNLSKWASPIGDSVKGNNANNRLKRLQKVVKETENSRIPKFNDSSGTSMASSGVSTKQTLTKTNDSPLKNYKLVQNLTSTPSPIPLPSSLTSPDDSSRSPVTRDKFNCKRKISDSSLVADEQSSVKKFLDNARNSSEKSPDVRKTIVDKIKTVQSLNNVPRLSSRILKIKHKTEEINSSINSSSLSPVSEKYHYDESHRSPLVKTPLLEQSNIWQHSESNKSDNQTPDKLNFPIDNSIPDSKDSNFRDEIGFGQYYNVTEFSNKSSLNKLSPADKDFCKVQNTSAKRSLSQRLKPSSDSYLSKNLKLKSLQNNNVRNPELSRHTVSKESVVDQFNKSDLNKNLRVTTVVISPQNRLNRFKVISVDKSKTRTSTTPDHTFSKDSLERNFNNISATIHHATSPLRADADNKRVSSVDISKSHNSSNLKVPFGNLTQESLSNLNNLPVSSSDNFDEKMAMTATWIRHHQQFAQHFKSPKPANEEVKTVVLNNQEVIDKNVEENKPNNVLDDSEEMEWSNAEPDTDTQEPKAKPRHEEAQTTVEANKTEGKDKRLCIVVDTNIFISELSKIIDIVNLKVTGPAEPLIYIPWMVVTELDEMKDRPGNNSLKNKVMNAIKCINKLLSEENPRVKGQTISDMGKQKHVGASQDDKIIGTCLQALDNYENVILLSNDVNLKNKAMINGIGVSSAHEIIMKIMSKFIKDTKYKKIGSKMSMLCSSIICDCAKEAYGDVWMRMDMLSNPPWSLLECTKRFRKYWVAVFDEKLMKQFLTTVERLENLLTTNKYFCDDSDKYNEFVKLTLNLCIFLKDIEDYRGAVENTLNDIIKIG